MQMRKKFVRILSAALAATLGLSILAACAKQNSSAGNDDTERVLRIAMLYGYGHEDEWFRSQFTELFEFANPNITIELVSAVDYSSLQFNQEETEQPKPEEEMKKLMQSDNPPDIVAVELNMLPELINENLLVPLDPLITADQFDTSKIVPAVIEGIKDAAPDGKLYALAPLFSSSALYYNKKMFQEKNVPFPEDQMTWDEIFNLARQLAGGEGEDKVYGFSFTTYQGSDTFWDMQTYTYPLQLSLFDPTGNYMAVDSDNWEQVWRTFVELRQEEVIPGPPNYEEWNDRVRAGPYDWDNFLSGRVAMAISGYYYINELINANRHAEMDENYDGIEWDVVTVPIHPENPGVGGQISLQGLMGINANAQNQDDAWEFLKFLNGEDWARMKSRTQQALVSHMDYLKPKEGLDYNISAFYQLKPAPMVTDDLEMWRRYPRLYMVQSIGQQKFQEVLNGEKEIRQALKEWQTEGDALLAQMREDSDYQGEMPEPLPIDIMPLPEVKVEVEAEAATDS